MTDSSRERDFQQIVRNMMQLGGGLVLTTALALLLTSVLGRTLGPADFGVYYLIATIVGLAYVAVDWGQATYVVREVARARPDRDRFIASAAALRMMWLPIAAVAVVAVTTLSKYPTSTVWLALAAVIVAFPASLVPFFGYVFRGSDRTELDVASGLILKTVGTLATILALWTGGGLTAAIVTPVVGAIAGFIFAVAMLRKVNVRFAMPNVSTMRELLVAGAPIVTVSATIAVHGFVEVTLLATMTTMQVVGWHGAARTFIGFLVTPAGILATASFPQLSRAADDERRFGDIVSSSMRLLLAASGLATCTLVAFSSPLISLVYGPAHFQASAVILQVCAPFFPIFFLNFLIGNACMALQKSVQVATAKIASVAFAALIGWILVRHFQATWGNGAIGIMIAYCATELLMTAALLTILPRGVVAALAFGHLAKAYLSAAVAAAAALAALSIAPIWVAFAVMLAVYAMAVRVFGLVTMDDVAQGLSLVRKLYELASGLVSRRRSRRS